MTMQYANAHGAAGTGTSAGKGGLGQWVVGVLQGVRAWGEERARFAHTRDELSSLSDRELNDIGLCRSDIEHVARKAACARA